MERCLFKTPDEDINLPSSLFKSIPCKNDSIILNSKTYIIRERIFAPKEDEIIFVLEEKL